MAGSPIWIWIDWGVLPGLVIVVFTLFWIFYDSHQQEQKAAVWQMISVLAMVLILPSVAFKLAPSLPLSNPDLVVPIAWLGIMASLGGLIALLLYLAGVGTSRTRRCEVCGNVLDPSWGNCPYCQQSEQADADSELDALEETRPLLDETAPHTVSTGARKTIILKQEPTLLAWLVMLSGPWSGRDWPLGEVTNIGRDSGNSAGNHLVIDDQTVSRQHVRIKLEEGEFVLYDLASTTGTFVNGEPVLKQALKEKDVIKIGRSELVFIRVKPKTDES